MVKKTRILAIKQSFDQNEVKRDLLCFSAKLKDSGKPGVLTLADSSVFVVDRVDNIV